MFPLTENQMLDAAHPFRSMEGVRLREHLMDGHGWTLAMVLARRGSDDYLWAVHQKEHEAKT